MAKLLSTTVCKQPLDRLIEQRGLLDAVTLGDMVRVAAEKGLPLEEVLVQEAGLCAEAVYRVVAEAYQLPFNTGGEVVPMQDLPESVARVCRSEDIRILKHDGTNIAVAISRPARIQALEAIFSSIGLRASFEICAPRNKSTGSLGHDEESLQHLHDLFSGIHELASTLSENNLTLRNAPVRANDISDSSDASTVVELVNRTLLLAVQQRASDIHIESTDGGAKVRFRIDGALIDRFDIDGDSAANVFSRILIIAGLDITERVMPQDGSFRVTCADRDVEFRIACIPGIHGQNIVLRLLAGSDSLDCDLHSLGMLPDELEIIQAAAKAPHGMILVAGPTGSGKSTTLYSLLEAIANPQLKFITIEDPVERRIAGVQQIQVRINNNEPDRSLTFARGLRTILRLDPDIIMIGEIRDAETAQIAVQASLTGHLVFSTVHANSSVETLRRLENIGVDFHLLMGSLSLIFAQRLLRRLCPACKQEMPPLSALKAHAMGLNPGALFRHVGCRACMDTGYQGRIGVFEFLSIDDQMRDQVARFGLPESILQIRERRLRTLYESAVLKVAEGITDLAELERVCGPCR